MPLSPPGRAVTAALLLTGAALLAPPVVAEVGEVRIAQQFGISYLPLAVMEREKLLEKAAAKEGVANLQVTWLQFGAGNAMNEALLSQNLDLATGGVGPLLTIWSKTKGRGDVKGVAALNSMPLYLVTVNPNVKTLKDFTAADKIALPAVKVSIQAVTLQMAAEQAFGAGQQNKLDAITVSMKHPDAMAAMLSGKSEVTAHFGSAPFQYQEIDAGAHRVVNSYDVLGGPSTFNTMWTTKKFHDSNPRIYRALIASLDEAMSFIKENPRRAAEIYLAAEKSTLPVEYAEKILRDPENVFTTAPQNVMKYADFMHKVGAIENRPATWTELFFPEIHNEPGS